MAVKLNKKGYDNAKALIKSGKVDKESDWSFTAEDGNNILGDNNWDEYSKWFLGIDTEANEETKARYKFPFGKNGKVYRKGVVAAKQRAAQQGYEDIVNAADDLLQMIDENSKENEKSNVPPAKRALSKEPQIRTLNFEVRSIDEENRIVELSFSSEEPVERWYGKEILLHEDGAVDFTPLLEVGAVLKNHDPDQIVGKPLRVWIDPETRKGRAEIQFIDTPKGREAFQEVKEGALRGVSVGYKILEYRYLEENEVWSRFQGPSYVITRWNVIEISLTPIPADATVGVGRTLKSETENKEVVMPENNAKDTGTQVPEEDLREEILKKERERVSEIRRLGKDFGLDDLADKLIEEGKSVEEARKAFLDTLKERAKPAGISIEKDEREKFREAAVNAILARAGYKVEGDAHKELIGMRLDELAIEVLRRRGLPVSGRRIDVIGRAITHTESDFPWILKDAVNKALSEAYGQIETTYQKWTRKGSASDFKQMYRTRFGSFPTLPEVKEGGEYKHVTVGNEGETFSISTYGHIFTITRQAILNDDLGAFARVPREFAKAAVRTIEKTVYDILNTNPKLSDGKNLFSSSHNNLGTAGAIAEATLNEMFKLMREQKDSAGNPLNLQPAFLLVPSALEFTAKKWAASATIPGEQTTNVYKGLFEVIATAYLGSVNGGSDTAWYGTADPYLADTIEVAFLDGNEQPTVETREGFTVDGIEFKVRIDFGAAALDYRGLFKNAGA